MDQIPLSSHRLKVPVRTRFAGRCRERVCFFFRCMLSVINLYTFAMKILKSYTYTWQQIGIFKLALLAVGAAIGANWHEFFEENMMIVLVIAIAASAYTIYESAKQVK